LTIETESELKEILKTIGYSNKAVNAILSWYVSNVESN